MNDHNWQAPTGHCADCGIGPLCAAAFTECLGRKPVCRHCGDPLKFHDTDSGYPATPDAWDGWGCTNDACDGGFDQ